MMISRSDTADLVGTCRNCGAERPDPYRFPGSFCPACGRPVHDDPVDDRPSDVLELGRLQPDGSGHGPFVVERGRDWFQTPSWVSDSGWLPRSRLAVVAGALVVALFALVVVVVAVRSVNPDPVGPADPGDQVENSASSRPAQPETAEGGKDEESVEGGSEVAQESGDADQADRQLPISLTEVIEGTDPVLGEAVGQYLFVDLATDLVRLDLDSGRQHWFKMAGAVVGSTDRHLIVVSDRNVFAVDVSDMEAGGRFLQELPGPVEQFGPFPAAMRLDDGRVAIPFADFGQTQVRTGSALVQPDGGPDDVELIEHGRWWPAVPGLPSVPGSGAFDVLGPEPRKVFDGMVVAGGARRVLGIRCQDLETCEVVLVDRATGDVLVDGLSPDIAQQWQSRFVGIEERLLVTWIEPDQRSDPADAVRILDLEAGEDVAPDFLDVGSAAALGIGAGPELLGGLDASSDSRLLAGVGNGVVAIFDRDSDGVFSIDIEQATRSGNDLNRVVFMGKDGS